MRASRSRQQHHLKQNNEQFSFLNLQRPRNLRCGQKSRSLQKLNFDSRHFKLGLRAKGLSLLSLALRPGLLGQVSKSYEDQNSQKMISRRYLSWFWCSLGVFVLTLLTSNLESSDVSAASLTLSVPSSTLSLEITPNGQFKKSSEAKITTKTDALAGYTLSVKSNSDNKLMNDTYELNSITEKVTEEQYNQEGNSNTWGYNLIKNKVEMTDNNTNFLPGPTTEASTIDKTSVKNDENNTYTITLGAKVDTTLPTGIYTNTFVFLASANSFEYTINYNGLEGASTGPTTPQTGSTIDATIKLDSTPPTKSGYEFLGWCDTTPTSNNTASPSCSGKTYQAGGDYTFTNPNSSTLTLYAIWESSVFYMQDFYSMNPSDKTAYINGMVTNTQYEMVDKRDNKTYYVAKLADGNVWMTENLDFDINSGITYTPEDTDIKSNWRPNESTYTSVSWANTSVKLRSMDPGNICWDGSNFYSGSDVSISINTKSCNQHDPSHYHFGNYYNWIASAAMNSNPSSVSNGQDANQSVCPAGWRVPKRSGDKSYVDMSNSYSFTSGPSGNVHLAPYYFNYTGHWNGNTYYTYNAAYWTNTIGSSSSGYYFSYYIGSNSRGDTTYSFYDAFQVRCVVR